MGYKQKCQIAVSVSLFYTSLPFISSTADQDGDKVAGAGGAIPELEMALRMELMHHEAIR